MLRKIELTSDGRVLKDDVEIKNVSQIDIMIKPDRWAEIKLYYSIAGQGMYEESNLIASPVLNLKGSYLMGAGGKVK